MWTTCAQSAGWPMPDAAAVARPRAASSGSAGRRRRSCRSGAPRRCGSRRRSPGRRLPHGGRLGHRGDLDGALLGDPLVALVGVEEADALLHHASYAGAAGGLDHVGHAVGAQPVVAPPGPGDAARCGRPGRSVARLTTASAPRRPRSRLARSRTLPRTGLAPRPATRAARRGGAGDRDDVVPASRSDGTAARPMTPVPPVRTVLTPAILR